MPTAEELFAAARLDADAGRSAPAEALLLQALALDPNHAGALHLLGALAYGSGRPAQAAGHFRRASAARPGDPSLLTCLGAACLALGHREDAERWHRAALALAPGDAQALNNLGIALASQRRHAEAADAFRAALAAEPADAAGLCNLGAALRALGDTANAADCYRQALALRPDLAQAHHNLGNLFYDAGRLDEAEAAQRRALGLWRGPGAPWPALGLALLAQGRLDDGRACLAAAMRLRPGDEAAHSTYLATLLYDPEVGLEQLAQEHRHWAERHAPPRPAPPRVSPGERLRVGYISPDFRRHPVAHFVEPLLRHHDVTGFEVFCYSDAARPDEKTAELRGLAEQWRDTHALPDAELAELVSRDGIDVLVDLAGHTVGNRLKAFALRPAPAQVSYLGYPHHTGLPALPVRVGDAITDPAGEGDAGAVLRLPGCFCCYEPPRDVPVEGGLPEDLAGAVTFGSLHKLEKLNGRVLDVWGRLLGAVPNSRLLLARHTLRGATAERLRRALAGRGVAPERLALESVESSGWRHLRVYDRVDVLLDVWPWSGHATACEALWMGVPVVTLRGRGHAGRMTASVLTCLGLGGLVAGTEDDYVRIAAALAADRERRRELRSGLRGRMLSSPLCDGAAFTRGWENSLRELAGRAAR